MAAKVTIDQIKELRDRTGAGLMNCKEALIEADADIEKAIDILREKGIAKAAKKAGRVAAEGLALVKTGEGKAVVAEINCETDFVSSSDKFHEFTAKVMDELFAKGCKTLEEAQEATKDLFAEATIAMGEKFLLRRYAFLELKDGEAFGSYIHMGGKIAALAVLSKDLGEANRGIAMTIASAAPEYLTLADVPAADRERELAIAQKEVAEDPKLASKPENVKAMIAQRKVDSRLGENCLEAKPYALDPDGKLLVSQFLKEKGAKVVTFVRYLVGEGVDKSAKED
ncbi:MAG: translation elongation factor Ts [Mollicutes bacterium]|nr:translation elongation factor Ts [bacterium]MDD6801757.1 translation elongation factor Ts [Mollicutes bacterium]MDD7063833.1 translation elongation factor Ts [Mollicutes bacterium]MDY2686661.1 translation elongation factor Ts [Candidatus Enteromonas sp.]MDY5299039.1 translation elongation factor Ts [Candidatus Enteromonas sp.]